MTAEGAAFKEGTGGNDARCESQHENAGAEGILNDTPDMITPGDEDEQCVDDPDAVLFQEPRNGTVIANELLYQVVDRGERADRAPEATKKQKNDRNKRPPQHPGQGGAKIIMRGLWSKQKLEHDDHEEDQCWPLNNPWKPLTAHESVNRLDLQEIAPRENAFNLRFEFGIHEFRRPSL